MSKDKEIATFAGGCFWCTEAIFQRLEGVEKVISGYIGGTIKNPAYREICTGKTGHAEAIQIHFDPDKVSYEKLMEIFFATHDPTTLNQQGADKGTQYRSAIFYQSPLQEKQAKEFVGLLEENNVFEDEIITEITPASVFYEAEEEHQNYYNRNKDQPYCQYVIIPKLKKLKENYADKLNTAK